MNSTPPRKHRTHPDVWAGAVVTAAGIGYTGASLAIPAAPSASTVLGPSAVPLAIGIALVAAGAGLAVHGVRQQSSVPGAHGAGAGAQTPESGDSQPPAGPPPVDRRRFWTVTALLAAYVIAFIPLGYLLATAVFLLALTSYLQPRRPRRNVGYAIVFPLVVYAVFSYGLQVDLPVGLFGVG